jgi:hypothetical protein
MTEQRTSCNMPAPSLYERQEPWRDDPKEGWCNWEVWRKPDLEDYRVDIPVFLPSAGEP